MSAFSTIQRAARLGLAVTGALASLPPLLTRLVMGQAFFLTGRGKLENFDHTVQFFTNLGVPMLELNAAFVSRLEFYKLSGILYATWRDGSAYDPAKLKGALRSKFEQAA